MSNRGRFGKYGELKRLERLRGKPFPNQGMGLSRTDPLKALPARKRGSDQVKVRRAVPDDWPFIEGLSREAFSRYGPYDEILGSFFREGSCLCFIASFKGLRCGFLMLGEPCREADSVQVEIVAVAVKSVMQRRGAASAMLREAELTLRRLGIGWILLHTGVDNTAGRAFFTARGFSPIGTRPAFYPMGQGAIVMKKRLL